MLGMLDRLKYAKTVGKKQNPEVFVRFKNAITGCISACMEGGHVLCGGVNLFIFKDSCI